MAMNLIIHLVILFVFPPLMHGLINRTKAWFAGRKGPPLLQPYYDLAKLLRKGAVFSHTTTWLFKAGPAVTLAAMVVAALLVPIGSHPALISFNGDMILFAYLFALGRFFTTSAALDTGSPFEGMGAAREVTFACLVEPTIFFVLITLARIWKGLSLSELLTGSPATLWGEAGAAFILMAVALFIAILAENCRIPFDDPNTHLELTMIHEVMVLDHSGPAFGLIHYSAALKLFLMSTLLADLVLPLKSGQMLPDWLMFLALMLLLCILIGTVESVMARLKLVRVPQLLLSASLLSAFALLLVMR